MLGRRKAPQMLGIVTLLAIASFPGAVSNADEVDGLPGYYTFFMKQAEQSMLPEESHRDSLIDEGEIAPIELNQPMPAWVLPDGFGNNIAIRDYIGKKNIVLTTMRTWW
ncbi:MAG: hypothetical protein COA73_06280 [Candidatus Hydrogenedentota bacterium]|nr:MAG: hypothetical protein COA73_06280 [Candidatus Hydrogenedentota bacterium]